MRLVSLTRRPILGLACCSLFLAAGALSPVQGQGTSTEELFVSSDPETLVTLTFSLGFDTTEHYSDHQTRIVTGETPFASLDAGDLAGSGLLGTVSGSAFADQGTLRSTIEITPQPLDTNFYTATSTAAFTDTFTVSAPGQEGQSGTLHLEYAIDGRATGTASTLAAALSLTLIGEDNFTLTEPFSESFATIGSPFDITFTSEDPLTTTLDIDIVFGQELTYGASLGLTLIGEGKLDFSDTVRFTGASVTQDGLGPVPGATIESRAGITYGDLNTIPEPGTTALLLLSVIGLGCRRRRGTP